MAEKTTKTSSQPETPHTPTMSITSLQFGQETPQTVHHKYITSLH